MPISAYDQINYAAYKPLSIQEIWAPGQAMRAEHDKLQEEYSQQELLGGAASLGLQKGVDDIALASNEAYMKAIKDAADQLATKGFIDSGRRRGLISLKQQYTQNVLPIQNALKVRDEAVRFDREMKAKDQTYRSTFDPSKVAVTDYLNNNQAFNPQGVSVGIMSKDAANEFSQLKNLVSQKYPSIAQSGVIGTLWTKVNSGVSIEEISGFIKNEAANKNIDPKVLSSLGQEMHNIVENNLQKHGAYKAFGNDENAMKDLRSSVANMAIYSLGDPKFGQMNDPMAVARAQAAENPPEPPGKQFLRYDPSFEKQDLKKIDDNKNKLLNSISDIDRDIAHRQTLVNFGRTKEDIRTLNILKERRKSLLIEHNNLQSEYLNFAKASGIKIPKISNGKIAKSDYESFISLVSEKMKEDYKSANKTRYFFNTKPETQQEFSSALSSMDKVVDINGDELSKSDILENGKLKSPGVLKFGTNGMYLQIVDKNNNSKTIQWNPEYLGNPAMASDYVLLTNIKNDSKGLDQKDFEAKYGIPLSKSKTVIENLTTKISNGLNSQYTQTKTTDIDPGYQQYQYGQQ